MKKTEDGKYILNGAELGALIQASMETATKVLQDPTFDPNNNGLPYYVNKGHRLLYEADLYTEEQLTVGLATLEKAPPKLEPIPLEDLKLRDVDASAHIWVKVLEYQPVPWQEEPLENVFVFPALLDYLDDKGVVAIWTAENLDYLLIEESYGKTWWAYDSNPEEDDFE